MVCSCSIAMLICPYSVAPAFSQEVKEKPSPLIACLISGSLIYAAGDLCLAGILDTSYLVSKAGDQGKLHSREACLDLHQSSAA